MNCLGQEGEHQSLILSSSTLQSIEYSHKNLAEFPLLFLSCIQVPSSSLPSPASPPHPFLSACPAPQRCRPQDPECPTLRRGHPAPSKRLSLMLTSRAMTSRLRLHRPVRMLVAGMQLPLSWCLLRGMISIMPAACRFTRYDRPTCAEMKRDEDSKSRCRSNANAVYLRALPSSKLLAAGAESMTTPAPGTRLEHTWNDTWPRSCLHSVRLSCPLAWQPWT